MATYPNEIWPGDVEVELLDGTSEPLTGLPYIAKGTGPTSVPSLEVQYNRREQRLNSILASWRQGMVVAEGNTVIGVYPISYTLGGERRVFAGRSGIAVPAGATRVVYLDHAGELTLAVGWPAELWSFLPLAVVDTTDGAVRISDARSSAAFHVPSIEIDSLRDRWTVCAGVAAVGPNQSDARIFEYDPPAALVLAEVQVFCTAVSATAEVDLRAGGVSVLINPATPAAGAVVKPAIFNPDINGQDPVSVHVTSGASGGISNLAVTMLFKAMPTA